MIATTRGGSHRNEDDVIQPCLCQICFLLQPADNSICAACQDQFGGNRNDCIQDTVFHQDPLTQDRVFEKLISLTIVSQIFIPDIHVLP
jgi:hypothetical protein